MCPCICLAECDIRYYHLHTIIYCCVVLYLGEEEHLRGPGVGILVGVAQAQKQGFKLKALLSFSQSNFETGCFQARVELPSPHLVRARNSQRPVV